MTLGSKVNDAVDLLILHQLVESIEVADIHPHKLIIGLVLDILEIGQVSGVSQLIEVDDAIIRIFVHKEAYHMTSYKARTPCNNDRPHILLIVFFIYLLKR